MVAIGTRISPRPPHRSRRALLTHRAPPALAARRCAFILAGVREIARFPKMLSQDSRQGIIWMRRGEGTGSRRRVFLGLGQSTSRIACAASFDQVHTRGRVYRVRRADVPLFASRRAAQAMYSPRMRLASSTARMIVSWSGLFRTANSLELASRLIMNFRSR